MGDCDELRTSGGVIDFQTGACRRNGDDGHDGDDYDGIGDQLPLPHTYIMKLALPEPQNCVFRDPGAYIFFFSGGPRPSARPETCDR